MKYRTTLLAGLGVLLASGLASTACTSPDRAYGVVAGATSGTGGAGMGTGVGGGSTSGTGMVMMSTGTGTTTNLPCAVPSDCPGKETECQTRTCDNSLCGIGFSAAGKAIAAQFVGDCQEIVCDGQGTVVQQVDSTDIPDDSNPCTQDVCTAGVPSHPPAPFGTTCGGALTCDNQGHCTGCAGPGDCPGADTDCQTRSCTGTVCGFIYQQSGTKVTMQTPADCKQNVCNGMGAVSVTFDGTDLQDDSNDCTLDGCANGLPTHANLAAGATCASAPSNTVCNGGGACVQCVTASTCPGADDECKTRKCAAGACGFDFTAQGTLVALQTGGDCHKSVCDGNGGVAQVPDDTDVQNDGNPCTGDSCSGGAIVHAPVAMGTDCGAPKKCDGGGNCAGCLGPTDCAGTDTECQSRTCSNGVCGLDFVASGTPVAAQTPNDCKKNVCDGSGNTTVIADDSDVASDGVECTSDTCAGGAASYPPSPPGSTCTVGGTVCNGVGGCGVCTPGDSATCNCVHKTFACCNNPTPNVSGSDVETLVSGSDSASDVPDFACCCIETKDCDGSGQWGLCY